MSKPNLTLVAPTSESLSVRESKLVADLESIDPRHPLAYEAFVDVWHMHLLARMMENLGWYVTRIGDRLEFFGHNSESIRNKMMAGIHSHGLWVEGANRKRPPRLSEQFTDDLTFVLSEYLPGFEFKGSKSKPKKNGNVRSTSNSEVH